MRVAHFIHRYPPALGGSEAYFARLSRYCAERGDQVSVFTSNALELEAFWARGKACVPSGMVTEDGVAIRRYPLSYLPARRHLLKALSFVPHRLWQCLTLPCNPISVPMWRDAGHLDQRFDVVHAAAFPYAWPIACARRLARRLDIPLLLTPFLHLGDAADPHNRTRRGYTSPPLRWLLREADAVFVQTPAERNAALALGVPAERAVLQGLGVDPHECTGGDRTRARAAWGVAADEVVFGHLANLSAEKGSVDLLEAAALLWGRGLAVRVVLAGPSMANFRTFWARFAQEHPEKAGTHVIQPGVLSDEQKKDFFAGCDAFVLPSRSDSFGLVLLEAWANGLPNIAYRAGGPAELLTNESDGLLVSCGDIAALAHAMERLASDQALRKRLATTGQGRIAGQFRWDDKLDLVRQTYERLVREGRGV